MPQSMTRQLDSPTENALEGEMANHRKTEDDFARDMKERRQARLTRGQQKDRETHIKRGQESWQRHIHKGDATWNDWMAIGAALLIGRQEAMAATETEQPIGSRYNSEFGSWLARHHFDNIDKGDRSRLIVDRQPASDRGLASNADADRLPASQSS